MNEEIVIIGAGPAGLTAAYLLAKKNKKVVVLEADPKFVGGISRTVEKDGFAFDIGGHRFFSKSQKVNDFWVEILPNDFIERERSSKIYFRKKFFKYPLSAKDALWKLGPLETLLCVLSYFKARLLFKRNPRSYEEWVVNEFGRRLFDHFFKSYTEKVWGMKCSEISADWAAQRIKGLSLWEALRDSLFGSQGRSIKTLTNHFYYPRRGPGMMWQECAKRVQEMGGKIIMGAKCEGLHWNPSAQKWTAKYSLQDGGVATVSADQIISSAPIAEMIPSIEPKISTANLSVARGLKYRDFVTVVLILRGAAPFDDQWIYIHEPSVRVGRIQNFRSWSPDLVPQADLNSFGLEYFCNKDDSFWSKPDHELIEIARSEFTSIGLNEGLAFVNAYVVRQPKAYPVYDDNYEARVNSVRTEVNEKFPTFHFVGRNGMHKYNNQDHAMMTAMLTVENILSKKNHFDIWQVNQDAEYHESGERLVPRAISDKSL